jgi:imidazolonepropionase-like amidohydrolase
MASGGVASPTDRLTNTQFSVEEIKAIVEEAEAAGKCSDLRYRHNVPAAIP